MLAVVALVVGLEKEGWRVRAVVAIAVALEEY